MKKYRLMIIDDEIVSRRMAYEAIFDADDFELIFVDSYEHLSDVIRESPIDAYLVDSLLDQGDWAPVGTASKLFDGILSSAPWKVPVFLVSRLWSDPKAMEILTEISNQSSFDVVRFFAFQEFEQGYNSRETPEGEALISAIRYKIRNDLNVWHESSTFNPKDDQPIRILLLADLQYGDKDTSDTAVFDEQWLSKALNRDKLRPDFIVFAGDISYSGSPEEFTQAKEKLENLVRFMWGVDRLETRRERIILVPGNHDVNFRFSACDKYRWSMGNMEWADDSSNCIQQGSNQHSMLATHAEYALEPFRQFSKSMTGSKAWDDIKVRCRVDRRFEHCGIRFFLFNSVSGISINSPTSAAFNADALREITEELGVDDDPRGIFSIAVSHHGIKSSSSDVQISNWDSVGKQYFNQHKIKMWMFGHYHEHSAYTINEAPFDNRPHLGIVQAATLKIRPNEGDRRGFSLIELVREDGRVVKVKDYFYEMGKHGIADEKPTPKDIDIN